MVVGFCLMETSEKPSHKVVQVYTLVSVFLEGMHTCTRYHEKVTVWTGVTKFQTEHTCT